METNAYHTRTIELLADRSVQPLSPAESRELEGMLRRFPELEGDQFERAAAAIDLAISGATEPSPALEPMPEMLRRRIARAARDRRAEEAEDDAFEPAPVVPLRGDASSASRRPWRVPRWVGVAAAASLFIASTLFVRDANTPLETQCILERVSQVASVDPRQSLMTEGDVVQAAWSPAEGFAEAVVPTGDLVWSSQRQQGVLTLRGLPAEELASATLHLWIFEAENTVRPIDGGAFAIDAEGHAVMTIELEGGPIQPVRFILTVDQPGSTPHPENPLLVASLATDGRTEAG